MEAVEVLYERYIAQLRDESDLFVGIELEFPIVNQMGQATDTQVSKDLMVYLARQLNWSIMQRDMFDNPVQLVCPKTGDQIVFELSYNTLEFAFSKAVTIGEVNQRFQNYLQVIQDFLASHHHALMGCGIHPYWNENNPSPVALPRYQMLMAFLELSQKATKPCHDYPYYGTFICGSQVQLDVTKSNYLRVLNAFNQIEAAKAYLFSNSEFSGEEWDTLIARDRFWEESMHGILSENIGVFPKCFYTDEEFLDYMSRSAIYTVTRDNQIYYFSPISAKDYLATEEILAYNLDGDQLVIQPQVEDFSGHRPYYYQDLTTRGTVEFRSCCTQPLDQTFTVAAFHLGLLNVLDELEAYLASCSFFEAFSRDYPSLRRQFSRKLLTADETRAIRQFSRDLLVLSQQGLEKRSYNEETYLEPLWEKISDI